MKIGDEQSREVPQEKLEKQVISDDGWDDFSVCLIPPSRVEPWRKPPEKTSDERHHGTGKEFSLLAMACKHKNPQASTESHVKQTHHFITSASCQLQSAQCQQTPLTRFTRTHELKEVSAWCMIDIHGTVYGMRRFDVDPQKPSRGRKSSYFQTSQRNSVKFSFFLPDHHLLLCPMLVIFDDWQSISLS
jgi:hypothetical protein